MKSETYPLAVPADLLAEMRHAAKQTNLSVADTMRQSMKLGLPKLLQELSAHQSRRSEPTSKKRSSKSPERLSGSQLKPFTAEERRLAYQTPNPEFDALEHHCALLPKRLPEE